MYLRGSNLSLRKKRRRGNPLLIILLTAAIAFLVYFNVVVAPNIAPPFVPTPTETRDPVSFEIEADGLAIEGKFLAAIETYQAAINANPKNIDNYLKIARLQIYSGNYSQAQVNAENCILLDKSNADAFALLVGGAKALPGRRGRKAPSLDPNNAIGHAIWAYLLALRVEVSK